MNTYAITFYFPLIYVYPALVVSKFLKITLNKFYLNLIAGTRNFVPDASKMYQPV